MSRQTGADDAGFTPRSRSIQVEEFEVAIPGGIWVAIGGIPTFSIRHPSGVMVVIKPLAKLQGVQGNPLRRISTLGWKRKFVELLSVTFQQL